MTSAFILLGETNPSVHNQPVHQVAHKEVG